jgi:lysophospholipase
LKAEPLVEAPFHADLADGPDGGRAFWVQASDGVRVRLGLWATPDLTQGGELTKGTVLLLPGRTEYIEKYGRAAQDLTQRGYATLSIDWRGQGLADRPFEDPMVGHIEDFSEYQLDLAAMVSFAETQNLPKPYYMIAHSMGGCIALRALINGLKVNAVAFSSPMWGILMAAWMRPMAQVLANASRWFNFDHKYAPGTGARTYVVDQPFSGNTLTTDAEMWAYMREQAVGAPELALGGPSLGWLQAALAECHDLSLRDSPTHPALCALGTAEKIVDVAPIHNRMARWSNAQLDLYPGAEHEVMMERPASRQRFFDEAVKLFAAHP